MRGFGSSFTWLVSALLVAISTTACGSDKNWIEEAALHDGRVIEVHRTVSFHMGGGELSQALTRWPDQYKLSMVQPNTGKKLTWSGERHFNPVLIDFVGSNAYLVAVANGISADLKAHGCPEIPYVFFRQKDGEESWAQIAPTDIPSEMLHANLAFTFEYSSLRKSAEDVERHNISAERSTSNHITRAIPTSFSAWKAKYKNEYRVGHYQDGCRHTVPSNEDPTHPQAQGQPSQRVTLEVIDSKTYAPERVIPTESVDPTQNWQSISWDRELATKCNSKLKQVGDESDRPELRGWLLFTSDATGQRKARRTGDIFCTNSALWFGDYVAETNRLVLTKFTTAGDFVYRLSFDKPEGAASFPGFVLQPTFRVEAGYLYFDWWNGRQSGREWLVSRTMKVRLKEPDVVDSANKK